MQRGGLYVKLVVGTMAFFLIIFICAGRIDYWQGWVYAATGALILILSFTVFRIDDELMKERSKPGHGVKQWDKIIVGISSLAMLAMFVVAGLDSGRFKWSPNFHIYLNIIGIVMTATGELLFIIAQKQNRFFSSFVRIQTERSHVVCDAGLYGVVRHPAYLGSLIQTAGYPLLMGSLWSIIPVGISLVLLLVRTGLEDKTLLEELTGYKAYADKTKFRLIPFVW